jgi:hypothetical protein
VSVAQVKWCCTRERTRVRIFFARVRARRAHIKRVWLTIQMLELSQDKLGRGLHVVVVALVVRKRRLHARAGQIHLDEGRCAGSEGHTWNELFASFARKRSVLLRKRMSVDAANQRELAIESKTVSASPIRDIVSVKDRTSEWERSRGRKRLSDFAFTR